MYSLEKARKEGLEYCQKLASGITKEELRRKRREEIEELRRKRREEITELEYERKFTREEYVDLVNVYISIELAAIKSYCPSYQ